MNNDSNPWDYLDNSSQVAALQKKIDYLMKTLNVPPMPPPPRRQSNEERMTAILKSIYLKGWAKPPGKKAP